ncbi:MAG: hypothetical protein M3063_00970 [Actinomycetota bacterium]|nr:hypothetical protein [Actinomycetota bacterium]
MAKDETKSGSGSALRPFGTQPDTERRFESSQGSNADVVVSPQGGTDRHVGDGHHRKLDDSLIREWAPRVGRRGQTWEMIMWAMTQNALAIAYHRKRKRLQASG